MRQVIFTNGDKQHQVGIETLPHKLTPTENHLIRRALGGLIRGAKTTSRHKLFLSPIMGSDRALTYIVLAPKARKV